MITNQPRTLALGERNRPSLRAAIGIVKFFATLCCFSVPAHAVISVAPIFQDHAVVQEDQPISVWGWASWSEPVDVSYAGQHAETQADSSGHWAVQLQPVRAHFRGDLIVSGWTTVVFHEVATGEVWLCGGQSNMEWPVSLSDRASDEIASATDPDIEEFRVGYRQTDQPGAICTGRWVRSSPQTVGRFTAVGYFFARELRRHLDRPVGLIHCSQGGTPVEAWISHEALQREAVASNVMSRWEETLRLYPKRHEQFVQTIASWRLKSVPGQSPPSTPQGPDDRHAPSGLFNGMVSPLIPYTLRGVLWYQGEENTGHPDEYHQLFTSLIADWRRRWNQPELPFLYVQLPNISDAQSFSPKDGWPALRQAQLETLAVSHTGMAVAIDIGDPFARHPRNKQEVGRRLALLALAKAYGQPVNAESPIATTAEKKGAVVEINLSNAEHGLVWRNPQTTDAFELAGTDGNFHSAEATLADNTVRCSSPEVPTPVLVRYAWRNDPPALLFNRSGLPVAPFLERVGPDRR